MDLNDLWIGDLVCILSSDKRGTFEGVGTDGRARIRCNGKILLVRSKNLRVVALEEKNSLLTSILKASTTDSPPKVKAKARIFKSILDLHIEALNPSMRNEMPQMILKHQIDACKDFVDKASVNGIRSITIIHGKGTGQLKREVEHILAMHEGVRWTIPQADGGSIEAWMR